MAKEKITVTIDSDLLEWVDGMTEKKVFASRSHAMERGLTELKKIL